MNAVTTTPTTLPALLRRNAATIGARPAVREKDRGIWQTFTWAQYYEEVSAFALGLAAHGFKRGDKLSVIGDNRPRLYWAQLAAQSLGGIAVPVFQDSIASELAYVFAHAEVSVIVAEDQEQVDKVLSLKDQLPALKLVVYDDPRGMRNYDSALLKSFEEMQAAGRTFGFERAGYVEAEIDKGAPSDIALFAYTSGTTGRPKGVMLSHTNMISVAESIVAAGNVRVDDEWLCYLPMAWIGDSLYSTTISLLVGFTCNCPENVETVQRDLRELGPSVFLAPPRIWENLLTAIQIRAADASPLKRRLFEFFRSLAERAELARHDGKPLSLATHLGLALGEVLVYAPVRDQLGLGRARWAYTGGAPLGADAYRFFRSFGMGRPSSPDWRRCSRTGRRTPTRSGAYARAWRCASPRTAKCSFARPACSRAITSSPMPPKRRAPTTAGTAPAMPAFSTRAGISSSSTAPRTWANSRTARRSPRNSSRTSSSSARSSAKRWRSATANPTSPRSSPSTLRRLANGRSGAASPTPRSRT
jgi:long-chain acyl-CoA synthetase